VVLVYADKVGTTMASVGIRAVELGRVLAGHGASVTIAAADVCDPADDGVRYVTFRPHDPRTLAGHLVDADVIVAQPQWPAQMALMRRTGARLIFDLYDPETFPTIAHFAGRPSGLRRLMSAFSVDRVAEALRTGSHVICATERQRDLWLGALLAGRGITPGLYDRDPSLRSVIDTVPFGVPSDPPPSDPRVGGSGGAIRGRFPEIGREEEIVLWNGGIWPWFDAPGAIAAVGALAARRPGVRLVFMGASTFGPALRATAAARAAAAGLPVVFNDTWVPYAERGAWLQEADCAISLHHEHLETRFSSRTRLLDCFWAGLPVVCTRGDEFAERIEREQLGATVAAGDVAGAVRALEAVLDRGRGAYAPALAAAAADHAWARVAEPLVAMVTASGPPRPIGPRRALRAGELVRGVAYRAAAAARVRP
jgi:glycosyltransferase involved in cell wall biosynthesis